MSRLRLLAAVGALALSACGGGTSASQPVQTAPTSKFALVEYVGDELTAMGCDPAYAAPYFTFQQDTPNAACSAVDGDTSQQSLQRLPAVLAQRPGVIVLLTGLNDIRDGSTSTDAIVEMVRQAQAQGVIVVLCTLPTSKDFDPEIQAWNAQIRQIARTYGTQLADYYAGMANPASLGDVVAFDPSLETAQLMDNDGVYPSAAGYAVLWDVVCEPLEGDHVVAE